jgi:hypothetical protein
MVAKSQFAQVSKVNSALPGALKTTTPVRQSYLIERVYQVALPMSIPTQICKFILFISNDKG